MKEPFTLLGAVMLPLVLGSPPAWANDEGNYQQDCCTQGCCWQEAAQGASSVQGPTRLTFPLLGLTASGENGLARGLRGITRSVYECPGHPEAASEAPGACEACGGAELSRREIPALESIEILDDGDGQTAVLTLTPGETVLLSGITAALAGTPVAVNLARLTLASGARLSVAGMTCPACCDKIQAALKEVLDVQTVSTDLRSARQSFATLGAGSEGVSYGAVKSAIADLGFQLEDVAWSGAPGVSTAELVRYGVGITGFQKRLGAESKLLVMGIVSGGAADKAGLEDGDRIMTINGHVGFEFSREELMELFSSPEPIEFAVQRNGEEFEVDLVPQRVNLELESSRTDSSTGEENTISASGEPVVGLNIGNTAPEIEGVDLDGVPFKLTDYRGKVVVVDFWGFW